MFIKATLLLLLGAAQAQQEVRTLAAWQNDDILWVDINGRKPVWIDNTCPPSQMYSFLSGNCINRKTSRQTEGKPRCHVQERWSFNEEQCIRTCYPNMYFYPSDNGPTGGECYDRATLMDVADPLCALEAKRYDVVDAMCIGDGSGWAEAEKQANIAALVEAERRAASIKTFREDFITEVRKQLEELKRLQNEAEYEAETAAVRQKRARKEAALIRDAIARRGEEARRTAKEKRQERRDMIARRGAQERREEAERRIVERRNIRESEEVARLAKELREALDRKRASIVEQRGNPVKTWGVPKRPSTTQTFPKIDRSLYRRGASGKLVLTNERLTNSREWKHVDPWTSCLGNLSDQKFSREEVKCINVCPRGYRYTNRKCVLIDPMQP